MNRLALQQLLLYTLQITIVLESWLKFRKKELTEITKFQFQNGKNIPYCTLHLSTKDITS